MTENEIEKYSRHILLPEVGGRGQEKLLKAQVQIQTDQPWGMYAQLYLQAAGCQVFLTSKSDAQSVIISSPPNCSIDIAGVQFSSEALSCGSEIALRVIRKVIGI